MAQLTFFEIVFSPRGSKVIYASDDAADKRKYKTRGNPKLDVFEQVFAKLIQAVRAKSATVEVLIEDDRYLVADPPAPPEPAAEGGRAVAARAAEARGKKGAAKEKRPRGS